MAGVWNFGQLAIYALGRVRGGPADAARRPGCRPRSTILLGGVLAAVISVLLAFPTLRLFGIYTSLLTFAFVAGRAVRHPQRPGAA